MLNLSYFYLDYQRFIFFFPPQIVKLLLTWPGVNCNDADETGATALMRAAGRGDLDVRLLLLLLLCLLRLLLSSIFKTELIHYNLLLHTSS